MATDLLPTAVVEAADATVADDRFRSALFAAASIANSGLVNIPAGRVEVYSDPKGPDPEPADRVRSDLGRAAEVLIQLPGVADPRRAVASLLPPIS